MRSFHPDYLPQVEVLGCGKKRPRTTPHFRFLAAILTALVIALPAAAQEQRGAIEGTVKDSSGGVIPGATVEAKSAAGTVTSVSDVAGKYRFPALRPGRWAVSAVLAGFGPGRVENVDLALGLTLKVDLTLGQVSAQAAVTVTGEAPLIDTTTAARYATITAENITKLPKGRDYTTLVTQAPGANNESKGAGISIDGATAAENRYVIDGIDTSNIVGGLNGKALITDLVEEVQVKSSGYTAEYGGSTGGVINVLTKSGTNTLKGDVGVYYTGKALGAAISPAIGPYADDRPTLRLDPNASGLVAQYVTYPKDGYTRWEPGFSLGGPIMMDRLWFFAAYQPAIISQTRTAAQGGGTTTISRTQDTKVQYATANLTSQISNGVRLRLAFNNSSSVQDGILPNLDGKDPTTALYDIKTTFPNWTLSGNLDVVASSNLYLGLHGGYFRSDTHQSGAFIGPRYRWTSTSNIGFPGVPVDLQHGAGFSSVPIAAQTSTDHDTQTRLSGQFDSTFYFHGGGDHAIKLGVQFDRLGDDVLSGETGNRVSLFWGRSLGGKKGQFGYYSVRSEGPEFPKRGFSTFGNITETNIGLFLQDTWTIANRLTISAGLRAENEHWPNFSNAGGLLTTDTALTFRFQDKLAPRIGLAWDPAGDSKTKIYASWGYFYDITKLNMPRGSFGGEKWLEYYYTLDTPNWNTLVDGAGCPPACPGTLIRGPIDFRLPSNIPGSDPPGIDPDIKPFKLQEYTAGIEHELTPVMSVGLRYVHKNIIRAIEDLGSQDAQGNETYTEGNPGFGLNATCFNSGALNVACPKARRDYDSVEATFNKRFADNWAFRFSYTWSRLYGNYSGLINSDENGRDNPNNNRNFDIPIMAFGQDGKPVFGVLPTDRTHQLKAFGLYSFPFGTSLGLGGYLASGIPITREAAFLEGSNYPVQYVGRNSDGRMPWYSQLDLNAAQDFRMGPVTVTLMVNVLNLLNQHIATNRFNTELAAGEFICTAPNPNGSCKDTGSNLAAFYRGFDAQALVTQQGLVRDPRFLKNSEFQNPRTVRLGAKVAF